MADATPAAPAAPAATPASTQASTPPAPPAKLKIGDMEFDPADALAEIQRGRQSGKILTEAQKRLEAQAKKEAFFESRKKAAKNDPKAILEAMGLSKEEATDLFSRYLYENEILPAQMSPEAKRIKELEAKNKEFENEKLTAKQKAEKAQFLQQVEGEKTKLAKEINDLLVSKKLPGTRFAVRRVADYLTAYAASGVEVPLDMVANQVMSDYQHEFSGIIDDATPEQLINFMGKDKFKALARKVSQWALGQAQAAQKPAEQQALGQEPEKKTRIRPQDFDRMMRSAK